MKYIVCSIYDTACEAYMRPFMAQTAAQAVRMFEDEANREGSEINAHPEHYALFQIATWTDHDAKYNDNELVECLIRGHEVQKTVVKLPEAKVQ